MSKYVCPECGNESDEPICKYCNVATENLKVDDTENTDDEYSKDDMKKAKDEEEIEIKKTNRENKNL